MTVHVDAVDGVQFAVQPPKVDPALGVSVSWMLEPAGKFAVHPPPQPPLIPAGVLTIVPVPGPTA